MVVGETLKVTRKLFLYGGILTLRDVPYYYFLIIAGVVIIILVFMASSSMRGLLDRIIGKKPAEIANKTNINFRVNVDVHLKKKIYITGKQVEEGIIEVSADYPSTVRLTITDCNSGFYFEKDGQTTCEWTDNVFISKDVKILYFLSGDSKQNTTITVEYKIENKGDWIFVKNITISPVFDINAILNVKNVNSSTLLTFDTINDYVKQNLLNYNSIKDFFSYVVGISFTSETKQKLRISATINDLTGTYKVYLYTLSGNVIESNKNITITDSFSKTDGGVFIFVQPTRAVGSNTEVGLDVRIDWLVGNKTVATKTYTFHYKYAFGLLFQSFRHTFISYAYATLRQTTMFLTPELGDVTIGHVYNYDHDIPSLVVGDFLLHEIPYVGDVLYIENYRTSPYANTSVNTQITQINSKAYADQKIDTVDNYDVYNNGMLLSIQTLNSIDMSDSYNNRTVVPVIVVSSLILPYNSYWISTSGFQKMETSLFNLFGDGYDAMGFVVNYYIVVPNNYVPYYVLNVKPHTTINPFNPIGQKYESYTVNPTTLKVENEGSNYFADKIKQIAEYMKPYDLYDIIKNRVEDHLAVTRLSVGTLYYSKNGNLEHVCNDTRNVCGLPLSQQGTNILRFDSIIPVYFKTFEEAEIPNKLNFTVKDFVDGNTVVIIQTPENKVETIGALKLSNFKNVFIYDNALEDNDFGIKAYMKTYNKDTFIEEVPTSTSVLKIYKISLLVKIRGERDKNWFLTEPVRLYKFGAFNWEKRTFITDDTIADSLFVQLFAKTSLLVEFKDVNNESKKIDFFIQGYHRVFYPVKTVAKMVEFSDSGDAILLSTAYLGYPKHDPVLFEYDGVNIELYPINNWYNSFPPDLCNMSWSEIFTKIYNTGSPTLLNGEFIGDGNIKMVDGDRLMLTYPEALLFFKMEFTDEDFDFITNTVQLKQKWCPAIEQYINKWSS